VGFLAFFFFQDGDFDSLSCREGDLRISSLSDNEGVRESGGEGDSRSVLDVDDVEGSRMLFLSFEDTDTTQVSSSGDHDQVSNLELDVLSNFSGGDVDLDGIVWLIERIREADGSSVVGDEVWESLLSLLNVSDFDEFVFCLLWSYSVDLEASLDIIEDTEEFFSFWDRDDIHESERIVDVSSDLSIDFDQSLHNNFSHISSGECIFQSISENDDERDRFSKFVWSR